MPITIYRACISIQTTGALRSVNNKLLTVAWTRVKAEGRQPVYSCRGDLVEHWQMTLRHLVVQLLSRHA